MPPPRFEHSELLLLHEIYKRLGGRLSTTGGFLDPMTSASIGIDTPHAEIHENHSYKMDTNDADINANPLGISFVTPNVSGKWMHAVFLASAAGESTFELREASTPSGGAALTMFNRNRNSLETSDVTLPKDGITVAGGTILHHEVFGQQKKIGGENRDITEWVLKENTAYTVTLISASAIAGQLTVAWYEHTNP